MYDSKTIGECVICRSAMGRQPDDNERKLIDGDEPLCWRCLSDAIQRQGWIVMATLPKIPCGVPNP